MKKKYLFLFLIFFFLLKITVTAQTPPTGQAQTPQTSVEITNPLTSNTFDELLTKIITFLFWIAAPIASLMIIIAAFVLLTGGGDPKKVNQAKNMIIWALVGFIIIFLSLALINFLKAILGVQESTTFLENIKSLL